MTVIKKEVINEDLVLRINELFTASDKVLIGDSPDDIEYVIVYEGTLENEDCVDESAPLGFQFYSEFRLEQTLMDSSGMFYFRHMQSEGIRYYGGGHASEPECEEIKKLKNIVWSDIVEVDDVEVFNDFYLS